MLMQEKIKKAALVIKVVLIQSFSLRPDLWLDPISTVILLY